ncbi:MAG: 50S ribosomal protein L25 [Patescibacteria group bacterium]
MTEFKLAVKERKENGKKTRKNGLVPGVVYGKDTETEVIAFDKLNFKRLFKEAGTSNLIDISIDDEKSFKTLIQDYQSDPVSSEILHVDFLKVNMKEKIHAEIPLEFVGESRAIIDQEGTLITPKDSIEVECLPGDLVDHIDVDISVLDDFEKDIRVSNLNIPAGIEVLNDPEEVVAHIEEPRSDEELAALEEEVVEDVSAVEVEAAGEEVPAGEEGAESAAPAEGEKPAPTTDNENKE